MLFPIRASYSNYPKQRQKNAGIFKVLKPASSCRSTPAESSSKYSLDQFGCCMLLRIWFHYLHSQDAPWPSLDLHSVDPRSLSPAPKPRLLQRSSSLPRIRASCQATSTEFRAPRSSRMSWRLGKRTVTFKEQDFEQWKAKIYRKEIAKRFPLMGRFFNVFNLVFFCSLIRLYNICTLPCRSSIPAVSPFHSWVHSAHLQM